LGTTLGMQGARGRSEQGSQSIVKSDILNAAESVLGRRALWRLGRNLYQQARAETNNAIADNGEGALQSRLAAARAKAGERLVVFDVGANVGDWTLSMLERARAAGCKELAVHAFEPVPATYQTLTAAVAGSPLAEQVTCVPKALSDLSGHSEIFVSDANAGTNSLLADAAARGREATPITIETQTALEYCEGAGVDHIDLLKIDAEGFDMSVVEGARGLLEQERVGVCQFEYNHCWVYSRHFLKDAFDLAASLGTYRVGKVSPDAIWLYDDWHPELERFFEANYALVHQSVEEAAGARRGTFDDSNTYSVGS
jgi:FkbM family methyltransferase